MWSRNTSRFASALLFCLAGLLCAPPSAQAAEPAQEAPESEIDKHVDLATQYFTSQKYDRSVAEWEQAYALDPQPIFLFNKAQSYRRGGKSREALLAYRMYLKMDPKTSLRA